MESNLLKAEIIKLRIAIENSIDKNKESLSSRTKLEKELFESGFIKISDSEYVLSIDSHGKTYITFRLVFRKRAVDILENHIVLSNGRELSSESVDKSFRLSSVRYNRVMQEIYKRASYLSDSFEQEYLYED